MIPEINIRFNRFLDPIFATWIKSQERFKDWTPPTKETVHDQIMLFREEWKKYGNDILKGMCEITGLTFTRNQIDVYVVSGNPRSFSRPIVIKATYIPINAINTITHELIHCLFSDNENVVKDSHLYPHENKDTANHVVVQAILKYIYVDVLHDPERLKQNIAFDSKPASKGHETPGYAIAWDIVEKSDYKELIKEMRDKYMI